MSRQNAFGFDLAEVEKRQGLRARYAPYWQVTAYGRAVGYQRHPSGKSYWMARVRLTDESYRQRRIGPTEESPDSDAAYDFVQAKQAAQRWFEKVATRLKVSDARPIGSTEVLFACPVGDDFTVGHALVDYVEWKRLVAARSHFLTIVVLINYHILPRLFSTPVRDFNSEKLRYFVKDVLETPPKRGGNYPMPQRRPIDHMTEEQLRRRKKTINTLIGILRNALIMAWENGKHDHDRAWRCLRRLPNVDRPRILHLSRPECVRLLEHCEPDLRRLVMGALYTGCRVTELLRMNASHVGRDGPGVYIEPLKTYRPRFVFLPDEGLAFFKELASGHAPNDLIFLRDDGRKWYTNYRPGFKRAVRAAGLMEAFCFHCLRHTYASQLVQAGTPLIVVAEQLGHANIDTVSRTYAHLSPQLRLSEIRERFASLTESDAV